MIKESTPAIEEIKEKESKFHKAIEEVKAKEFEFYKTLERMTERGLVVKRTIPHKETELYISKELSDTLTYEMLENLLPSDLINSKDIYIFNLVYVVLND